MEEREFRRRRRRFGEGQYCERGRGRRSGREVIDAEGQAERSNLFLISESLNAEWTQSSGSYATIFVKNDYPWYEGGGLFKRNNVFYTMIGTYGGEVEVR